MSDAAVAAPAQPGAGYITHEQMTIRDLQSQVASLTGQLQSMTAERDEFATGIEELDASYKGQITEFEAKIAATPPVTDPTEWESKYTDLAGKLRERDHRDAFGKVAGELDLISSEDAWTLSGYKPEGDAPDPVAIKTLLASTLESRPYLKRAAPTPTEPPPSLRKVVIAPTQPGPGLTRGQPDTTIPLNTVAAQVAAQFAATGRTSTSRI